MQFAISFRCFLFYHTIACVAGSVLLCVFFYVVSKVSAAQKLNRCRNRKPLRRRRGEVKVTLRNFLPSPPTPSFYFSSSDSAFAQTNLLLYEPHQKKHNEKRQLRRLIKLILGRFLQVYYCAHNIGLRFFSVTNLLNYGTPNVAIFNSFHFICSCVLCVQLCV